jgi:hypothetical protein
MHIHNALHISKNTCPLMEISNAKPQLQTPQHNCKSQNTNAKTQHNCNATTQIKKRPHKCKRHNTSVNATTKLQTPQHNGSESGWMMTMNRLTIFACTCG